MLVVGFFETGRSRAYYLFGTIDGPAVKTLRFIGCVLDLQTGFDVFDWRGDEGYRPTGHDAGYGVTDGGQFLCSIRNGRS